jgi:hypothetical protein
LQEERKAKIIITMNRRTMVFPDLNMMASGYKRTGKLFVAPYEKVYQKKMLIQKKVIEL